MLSSQTPPPPLADPFADPRRLLMDQQRIRAIHMDEARRLNEVSKLSLSDSYPTRKVWTSGLGVEGMIGKKHDMILFPETASTNAATTINTNNTVSCFIFHSVGISMTPRLQDSGTRLTTVDPAPPIDGATCSEQRQATSQRRSQPSERERSPIERIAITIAETETDPCVAAAVDGGWLGKCRC
jgi:hypothetical protein